MTLAAHALRCLYLFGGALAMLCATTSAQHGAYWYAAILATINVLLVTAAVRDYLDADERRAAAVKAERAARLRALADERQMRQAADSAALNKACCDRWWTSCGTEHDHPVRKDSSR